MKAFIPRDTVIICDIDGTVALHGDNTSNPRGHHKYDMVKFDAPNTPVIKLVHTLQKEYPILFVSSRPESSREGTARWLNMYGLQPTKLIMRKNHDYRPDDIVKRELFYEHIAGQFNVLLVIDDRDRVVDIWRSMGLTCLQVAKGAF